MVLVIVLRKPIATVLGQGVRRLKAGPVEVEFDQLQAEVRQELAGLADVSPRAAVLEAYQRIEARLVEVLDNAGAPSSRAVGGRALARLARQHDLISEETLGAIEGLSVLRDLTAHGRGDISVDRAYNYLALADAVLYVLRSKPSS